MEREKAECLCVKGRVVKGGGLGGEAPVKN